MKAKILSLGVIGALTLILFASLASAFTLSPTSLTFNPGTTSKSFTITNTDAAPLTVDIPSTLSIIGENTYIATFNITGTKIGIVNTSVITLTPQSPIDFSKFTLGKDYSRTLTLTRGTETHDVIIRIENNEYCEISESGSLSVEIDDISNKGMGEDESWYPLDEIEVKLIVKNDNSDEKIEDVKVEWGIYDLDGGKWIIEEDEKKFDIKKDDEEAVTITFKLEENIDEFESGDYTFYVRATGKEQNGNGGVCESDSKTIEIVIEDDLVVLSDIKYTETVSCGTDLQITADVWNIGDSDQEDVVVRVYIEELGINKEVKVGDIDSLDDKKLETTISIPEAIEEKTYHLKFEVRDENGDIYENNDEQSKYDLPLAVQGSCEFAKATLTAVIDSGGSAGRDLIIKATITNTGDKLTTYDLNAANYTEWASSVELDKSTIILASGESAEVLFTFKVKPEVVGEQLFNIEVLTQNKMVLSQPVSVPIQAAGGFDLSEIFGSNWYLWLIGALNIILIVVIIVVALRVVKK